MQWVWFGFDHFLQDIDPFKYTHYSPIQARLPDSVLWVLAGEPCLCPSYVPSKLQLKNNNNKQPKNNKSMTGFQVQICVTEACDV